MSVREDAPRVVVVIATRNRPQRLRRALDALRAQTLSDRLFEIVVVDDGSSAETVELLAHEQERTDGPALTVLRQAPPCGPAAARNRGWQAAHAPLVAFTDDDCEPQPGWLEALLAAAEANPGAILQGPTRPNHRELSAYGPFSHTVRNESLGRGFETANILYPRGVLERLGGFDEAAFPLAFGEDTDLAWRAIGAGVKTIWAPEAVVEHAVTQLGPARKLRLARRAETAMLAYKRHPELRRTRYAGVFWNRHHFNVVRAAAALATPRRFWWLRWWLAGPYVAYLVERRSGPLLAPYLVAYDLVEVLSCLRGSVRYRTLVI